MHMPARGTAYETIKSTGTKPFGRRYMDGARSAASATSMRGGTRQMTTLTFDCSPTMTDREVLRFCQDGYLMLRGVVSQETNDRVMKYCDEHAGDVPLEEEWFRQNVTLNPALTGVVRSLLGSNFSYFSFSASHRNIGPNIAQNWHRDGGSIYSPKMDCLQVFYLPQLTTLEMGLRRSCQDLISSSKAPSTCRTMGRSVAECQQKLRRALYSSLLTASGIEG